MTRNPKEYVTIVSLDNKYLANGTQLEFLFFILIQTVFDISVVKSFFRWQQT